MNLMTASFARHKVLPWAVNVLRHTQMFTWVTRSHDFLGDRVSSVYLSRIMSWYRYMGDVLVLWTGTKYEALDFVASLAKINYNLKFTSE